MLQKPYLSVIIPSYNEAKNIKRGVLSEVLAYLQKQKYTWELLLSDDGSTDDTVEQLESFAKRDNRITVLKNIHAGKGPTVRAGMLKAQGEWRLFADFDQSTPLNEVEKLFDFAEQGYEVVIGSREMMGATREKEPFHRHLMGRVFNIFVQIIAIPGILDTQCGFKLLSAKAAETLFPKLYIYGGRHERGDAFTGAFDVELLFLASKYQFKIREVPVMWQHSETNRVSPIKDSLRMFRDIIRVRWADISHKYKTT